MGKRLYSIDLLRGIFITLMTVGHAAYFIGKIHNHEFWYLAFSISESSPWFYIRVITYIGASGFFFLMGIGIAFLTASRLKLKWSNIKIQKFLITRGLLLVIIGMFINTHIWTIGRNFSLTGLITAILPGVGGPLFLDFGVLSSLGACMIITSFLTKLHKKTLFSIALLAMIIPYIYVNGLSVVYTSLNPLLSILMIPGVSANLLVSYSIFPWLSLCLFGVIWGKYYLEKKQCLLKITRNIGILLLTLFIISRLINIGNFHAINTNTITSFFALVKYPASISYILFTMGINCIILSSLSKIKTISQKNPLIVFGKSPLFFYITHLYLFLLLGLFFPSGASLITTYGIWVIGIIIMYFLSILYGKFKSTKSVNSIWKLF